MDNFLKDRLKQTLPAELPGIKSHLKMVPPGREIQVEPTQLFQVKESSVLIILYPENEELFCFLIKRPATMKHHAGQIAFPGGTIEQSDQSSLGAALREAFEEIGIDNGLVEVMGQLSKLFVQVSNFSIQPWVVWCDSEPAVQKNDYEVDKIIRFPVTRFLSEENIKTTPITTITGQLEVPCFIFDGEIIWGATAMILSELFDVIRNIGTPA